MPDRAAGEPEALIKNTYGEFLRLLHHRAANDLRRCIATIAFCRLDHEASQLARSSEGTNPAITAYPATGRLL